MVLNTGVSEKVRRIYYCLPQRKKENRNLNSEEKKQLLPQKSFEFGFLHTHLFCAVLKSEAFSFFWISEGSIFPHTNCKYS